MPSKGRFGFADFVVSVDVDVSFVGPVGFLFSPSQIHLGESNFITARVLGSSFPMCLAYGMTSVSDLSSSIVHSNFS